MYSDDYIFQKDLFEHKVFSSWQFIMFTQKNIDVVKYCFITIKNIIDKMTEKTVRWEQDLFADFAEDITTGEKRGKLISVTTDNQPTYETYVIGQKVDSCFLFDKLLRDFYQYSMNSLDSISQIANAGLLANNGKKVDSVDFQRMASTFAKQTYKSAFPKTSAWFENINNSSEFKYIEAINNRTKHTADIANKLSMGILGFNSHTEIGPFFRKETQHNKRELTDQLQSTVDFLNQEWENFLQAFCDEFVLDKYVDNRMHVIGGVYQQKMKAEPDQDLSYAYILTNDNFENMPDEIYILLAYNKNQEILAHTCPFERILVCQDQRTILGRYVAVDAVGDDCLHIYRKYKKDSDADVLTCIHCEMQGKIKFYHGNPFFNVNTISDDNEFIARCGLPF